MVGNGGLFLMIEMTYQKMLMLLLETEDNT